MKAALALRAGFFAVLGILAPFRVLAPGYFLVSDLREALDLLTVVLRLRILFHGLLGQSDGVVAVAEKIADFGGRVQDLRFLGTRLGQLDPLAGPSFGFLE